MSVDLLSSVPSNGRFRFAVQPLSPFDLARGYHMKIRANLSCEADWNEWFAQYKRLSGTDWITICNFSYLKGSAFRTTYGCRLSSRNKTPDLERRRVPNSDCTAILAIKIEREADLNLDHAGLLGIVMFKGEHNHDRVVQSKSEVCAILSKAVEDHFKVLRSAAPKNAAFGCCLCLLKFKSSFALRLHLKGCRPKQKNNKIPVNKIQAAVPARRSWRCFLRKRRRLKERNAAKKTATIVVTADCNLEEEADSSADEADVVKFTEKGCCCFKPSCSARESKSRASKHEAYACCHCLEEFRTSKMLRRHLMLRHVQLFGSNRASSLITSPKAVCKFSRLTKSGKIVTSLKRNDRGRFGVRTLVEFALTRSEHGLFTKLPQNVTSTSRYVFGPGATNSMRTFMKDGGSWAKHKFQQFFYAFDFDKRAAQTVAPRHENGSVVGAAIARRGGPKQWRHEAVSLETVASVVMRYSSWWNCDAFERLILEISPVCAESRIPRRFVVQYLWKGPEVHLLQRSQMPCVEANATHHEIGLAAVYDEPVYCFVPQCRATKSCDDSLGGHSFISFPADMKRQEAWLAVIGTDLPMVVTSRGSRICSSHFRRCDFELQADMPSLKSIAVPSVFLESEPVNHHAMEGSQRTDNLPSLSNDHPMTESYEDSDDRTCKPSVTDWTASTENEMVLVVAKPEPQCTDACDDSTNSASVHDFLVEHLLKRFFPADFEFELVDLIADCDDLSDFYAELTFPCGGKQAFEEWLSVYASKTCTTWKQPFSRARTFAPNKRYAQRTVFCSEICCKAQIKVRCLHTGGGVKARDRLQLKISHKHSGHYTSSTAADLDTTTIAAPIMEMDAPPCSSGQSSDRSFTSSPGATQTNDLDVQPSRLAKIAAESLAHFESLQTFRVNSKYAAAVISPPAVVPPNEISDSVYEFSNAVGTCSLDRPHMSTAEDSEELLLARQNDFIQAVSASIVEREEATEPDGVYAEDLLSPNLNESFEPLPTGTGHLSLPPPAYFKRGYCCCVPDCQNYSSEVLRLSGRKVSFHRMRAEWRDVIGAPDLTKTSTICSDHFVEADFYPGIRIRRLLPSAVPSVFEREPLLDIVPPAEGADFSASSGSDQQSPTESSPSALSSTAAPVDRRLVIPVTGHIDCDAIAAGALSPNLLETAMGDSPSDAWLTVSCTLPNSDDEADEEYGEDRFEPVPSVAGSSGSTGQVLEACGVDSAAQTAMQDLFNSIQALCRSSDLAVHVPQLSQLPAAVCDSCNCCSGWVASILEATKHLQTLSSLSSIMPRGNTS